MQPSEQLIVAGYEVKGPGNAVSGRDVRIRVNVGGIHRLW
jgi:hypothetical protein